jgi:hypothetical protein
MNRYLGIPIINVDNKKCYQTSRYPEIPLSDQDIYVYTTQGDRFDTLANQYYGDQSYWWIISIANTAIAGTDLPTDLPQDSLLIPEGSQIRIPAPGNFGTSFPVSAINSYENFNKT